MKEIEDWKKVKDFEDLYEVSNFGKLRSLDRLINNNGKQILKKGILLKQRNHTSGYNQFVLSINNKSFYKYAHRLVSEHFNDDFNNKLVINHKNGNKKDNFYKNLECCTQKENVHHAINSKLFNNDGYSSKQSKFNALQVKTIRKMKSEGFNLKQISEKYNVSKSTICRIINNKVYKNI